MRTYCVAQGTLLKALWWLEWEGSSKRGRKLIHFAVQYTLIQHCKATILQKKLIKKKKATWGCETVLFNKIFSSVQSLSCVQLFATPWIAARQASLSITISWSSVRLMSMESVMPSSHLILSSPFPPAPSPSQHQSLFQWVNSSHDVAKVLEFQF